MDSDIQYPSSDGNTYLDLSPNTTFDQIDSIVELDPLGDIKTESILGGTLPATGKNKAILNLLINPRDQKRKLLRVVAMNGHRTLNVNRLRVVFYDEESYEIEMIKDDTHWAVCASSLKLNTLDLEDFEFSADIIKQTWENYAYEEGDLGIYFPLAYYGDTSRDRNWKVQDFRPAHSIPFLLKEGFCACGWDFSSPLFEGVGKQLWIYALGADYGREGIENYQWKVTGDNGDFQATGPGVLGGYDTFRSKFVGIGTYKFKLEMEAMPYQFVLLKEVIFKVYRQFQQDGETKNNLIDEVIFPYPRDIEFGTPDDYFTIIDWEDTIVTVPGDDIVFTITYNRGTLPYRPLSEIEIPGHRYKASMEPDRKTYTDGDTLNIAKIIDPDVTLMDILKGVCHLFGRAKLYINNATKEIKLLPPFTTKWEDEVIEGFFKYDEQLILSEDILCDSMQAVGAISTTKKHQIKYKSGNNPLIEEDFQVRNVDFDNDLEDDVTEWENPSFVATINKKLPRSDSPRPPISWAGTSDGIDIMMFTEYEGSYVYDIGLVPFIAYGSYRTYGELVDDQLFIYPFVFEDNWEDIPVSGQKPNGYIVQDLEYKQPTPWLIYGEEPLKDLFSIFWREYFYKEQLSSKVSINVAYTSQQLAQLDYRKIYYVQYQQGFAGWLNRREFNYCKTDGTLLDFVPDLQIEPECIDPDTIPPVEDPCENTNTPEIEWEISEDCMLTYSQVGTIESNITGEQWLIRYEGQPSFSPAPPSPFLPDTNLYLRYEASTDDPNCTIPVTTVYINVCAVNVFELEVEYNELTDCYKIQPLIQGCNIYSDITFEIKDGDMYDPVDVENPTDPVEEWYVEICEPEDDFCIRATPTLQEGCEIDAVEVCVNLCPKEEDVECLWEEVEGGFKFMPETNIHKPIQSQSYYYDFDSDFPNPTQFQLSDTLTMVGRVYFRAVFTFTDCPDLIVECEYERNSNDCGLNTPGYECQVLPDGRLHIVRTGNLVTEVLLDIIRYRTLEESEWQTWDGKPIEQCPVYVQRLVIYCNDCPNSCTEMRLCECDILPPPTPDDCDDFDVKLNRYGGTLYATPSTIRNDIIYVFYKDGVEIQNSTSNIYNGMLEDGMYRVKAILGICEAQDSFEYDSGCTPPVIEFQSESNDGMEYTIVFSSNDGGNYQATHTYNTSENNEVTDTLTVTDNGTTVEVVVNAQYGINTIDISSTTACGMDDAQHIINIPCPEVNAGVNTYVTICEGCWGSFDPLLLMEGDPDSGGEWVDVQETGALVDGEIAFDTLPPGTFEFIYIIDTGSQLCNRYASLFVEVVEPLSAGESISTSLCHDAGETDLFSLLPGNPDTGGEWFSDDVIDGTIDLENGTITPAATDIGKTITIAYSHDQQTTPLPSGIPPAETWLEFDGVDDYVQAQLNTALNFAMPIKVDLEFDAISGDYIPILGKFTLGQGSNRYYMTRSAPAGYIGFGTVQVQGNPTNRVGPAPGTINTNQRYLFEAEIDGGDYVFKIDGVEADREVIVATPGPTTAYYFTLARAYSGQTNWHFHGKIYSFQVGTEVFPMNEGSGTTITGSQGTVLDIYGATWNSEGVEECNCLSYSLLTITIEDCTPPIPCPEDADLGVTITEETNASPDDPQWEDQLKINLTGSYEDPSVIDSDELYFSNDDGATWQLLTENSGDYFVKDDDYYVKLTSAFTTACNGGAQTGTHRMYNIALSNGDNVQEGQIRSRLSTYNQDFTDITPATQLNASGSSSSLIGERYFRWDVRHILNSGWELTLTHTHFDRGSSGAACPSGTGSFGIHFYSGHRSGKRRILVERRITYNNGCDSITIPETFEPTLPTCPEVPSNVGFNIVPPYKIGQDEYSGSVSCKGSVPGSSSDTLYVFEQPTGSNGYASNVISCGGSRALSFNYGYVFQRIIQFPDCPPIILQHNYNSPTSCSPAGISCQKEDSNGRARATRLGTPSNLSSDYLQVKVGSANWTNYTEGQWINVSSSTLIQFRRVANYNNGCPQTSESCSVTVSPPNYSLSITCVGGNTIQYSASNLPPGGVFLLYRNGVITTSNWSGNQVTVSQNGNYQVRYKYNQYQYIHSNIVNCGSSEPPCTEPTVSIGACSVNGNEMTVPFSTTNITSINQISASVDPGSGSLVWNSTTQQGVMTVVGTPGQSYVYEVVVTNSCGSDTATRQCQVGCSTLSFQNVNCNFSTGQTTFDVVVSPDTGVIPTTNGTYLSTPSSGRYRFRINQTSGTITASHPSQCTGISQSINCNCPEPVVNLELSCNSHEMAFSFTVTNPSSITSDFSLKVDGYTYTIANTGATSYSGIVSETGLSHNYDFYYTACGEVVHDTGTINCSCIEPTINASASCAGTTVNYSFSVNNESQIDQNYSVLLNGTSVATVVANSSGTYNGSLTVPPGSNNTIRIQSHSVCGNAVLSNTVSANCACPPASLSISDVTCNSSNQMVTFTVNQSNVTGLVITVNGNNVPVSSNPYTVQGVPGNNTISVQAQDSCAGTNLSDSVTYNCGCDQPSISVTAGCNTSGLVSYSFTVTDENLVNGNYSVIINGSTVKTITNTGAGTYNDTYQGSPGMNYSVRISAPNNCGSNTLSNISNTSCGCPTSVLSISNVSCNPNNQEISFNFTDTNVSNVVLKVNGTTINHAQANPITVQGQIGSNSITATAVDPCTGNNLSDSKSINCLCNDYPSVTIGTINESGGTITVNFSTTNISSTGQITFRGNGTIRSVSGSGGSWSASFPAVSGTNTIQINVSNSCGQDSDSDTYSYSPCVPPTITKVGQGTLLGGSFYVDFVTSNCTSISAPGATHFVNCNSTRVQWNPGSTILNWSITVTNDCGSDTISGSYDPCAACSASIVNLGCSSTPVDIDFIFMVDGSGSILPDDHDSIRESVINTINSIQSQGSGNYRFAVGEYSNSSAPYISWITPQRNGNYFNTYANTSSDLEGWTRQINDCARWPHMLQELSTLLGSGLNRRPGAKLHLIILHDSHETSNTNTTGCSATGPYSYRNNLLSQNPGMNISVVRYEDPPGGGVATFANAKSASMATPGGSWSDTGNPYCTSSCSDAFGNPSDPDRFVFPRRFYYRPTITSGAISDLVTDSLETCQLRADLSCSNTATYSWSVIGGGGSIIGSTTTRTITTNGAGEYQVVITASNGCQYIKTYDYSMFYTKKLNTKPGLVHKKEPEILKATDFTYDYSKLTEEDNQKLRMLLENKDYKAIQKFYNSKVISDYFFSCGCDNDDLEIIVKKYLDGLEV